MSKGLRPDILVITYWDRDDPLVINYTLPYLRIMEKALPAGSRIHLVTLDHPGKPAHEQPVNESFIHHAYRYRPFGLAGIWTIPLLVFSLCRLVVKHRIHTIHAWCTPAGMIGYLVSILTGRPLVIDSFEPHAEAMVENGTWRHGGLAFRILFLFEKLQTRRAHTVIAATEGMRDYARRKYGHVPARYHVKPACVDLARFTQDQIKPKELLTSMGLEGKVVAVYAGKFGGIYLEQEVFDLFRAAKQHWGDRFHVLLLTSHTLDELRPIMQRANLEPSLFTVQWAPPVELPRLLGLADWALTPVKPVPTKRYCTPIKDGEYWAAGLPVMITRDISDDSAIIERSDTGVIIGSLDEPGYLAAIQRMDELLQRRDRVQWYEEIRPLAERYRSFVIAERVYQAVYEG